MCSLKIPKLKRVPLFYWQMFKVCAYDLEMKIDFQQLCALCVKFSYSESQSYNCGHAYKRWGH